MNSKIQSPVDKWALFRFSVVGSLLANPPAKGELRKELERLSRKIYIHPITNESTVFHFSTIEAWYYKAKNAQDPIVALGRKIRSDYGGSIVFTPELIRMLGRQYRTYPNWSYKLHADNFEAELQEKKESVAIPSYASVRRRMVEKGWTRKPSAKKKQTAGMKTAAQRFENHEIRSYEAEYVHGLWHLDFHEGSLRVVDNNGNWYTPKALCILDDHSRLCCHIQWYLGETTQDLIHGLTQAFFKRGLPRALMTDNGAAMTSHKFCNGLKKTGILHETTLPYSPYQNGKQEAFWGTLEGRLMAMLGRVNPLTLAYLNDSSQAWVEMEYNKNKHRDIGMPPIKCLLEGKDVARPAPDDEHMRFAFTVCESRKQRKSDGTVSINGVRFEIPSRFHHMLQLHVCFTNWDKTMAWLMDPKTGKKIAPIYPQDKIKNASGKRKIKSRPKQIIVPDEPLNESEPALLRRLMAEYAQSGMPPAYLPKGES